MESRLALLDAILNIFFTNSKACYRATEAPVYHLKKFHGVPHWKSSAGAPQTSTGVSRTSTGAPQDFLELPLGFLEPPPEFLKLPPEFLKLPLEFLELQPELHRISLNFHRSSSSNNLAHRQFYSIKPNALANEWFEHKFFFKMKMSKFYNFSFISHRSTTPQWYHNTFRIISAACLIKLF